MQKIIASDIEGIDKSSFYTKDNKNFMLTAEAYQKAAQREFMLAADVVPGTEKAESEKVAALLQEEMENAVTLSVPLTADAATGKTWYDAKG